MSQELFRRLPDTEDHFTERKLEGADSAVFKKTFVAFANSLPPNRTGVLFVGVADDGTVRGVSEPEELQRHLRAIAENDCYPPIVLDLHLLSLPQGTVVAGVVPYSTSRPHFAGPAYVRCGSESVAATDGLYEELVLSRNEKCRFLLDHKEELWIVELLNKAPGASQPLFATRARSTIRCRIEEVTAFFVRFHDIAAGRTFTEILDDVHISFDDKEHRPRVIIWAAGRV